MKVSDIFKQMYEPQENALKVISLGWGVQSWTIAAMVALGELPPVDFAIHADTTHEASWTYAFAEKHTPWLEEHGVKVVTVKPVDNGKKAIHKYKSLSLPAYTGGGGVLRRQCTGSWKISPIRRHLQSVRGDKVIEQWIGITTDEIQRTRVSDVRYIYNRYPLLEKDMSRNDCAEWLKSNGLELPGRSSCTFCPYHGAEEWRAVMVSEPDRHEAIEADHFIRNYKKDMVLFIHPARVPIDEIDLRSAEEQGQMTLWDNECDGICGV